MNRTNKMSFTKVSLLWVSILVRVKKPKMILANDNSLSTRNENNVFVLCKFLFIIPQQFLYPWHFYRWMIYTFYLGMAESWSNSSTSILITKFPQNVNVIMTFNIAFIINLQWSAYSETNWIIFFFFFYLMVYAS